MVASLFSNSPCNIFTSPSTCCRKPCGGGGGGGERGRGERERERERNRERRDESERGKRGEIGLL